MKVLSRASAVVLLIFAVVSSFAAGSGSVHGTVTDPLGAVVPNATVKLLQNSRPLASANTDKAGSYNFSHVAPGRYQVQAEASTFAPQESAPIYVGNGNTAEINLVLKVGTLSQQIVVTATGTQLPESQVGASITVLSSDQFQNKLDVLEPLRQVPGAQIVQNGQRGSQTSLFIRGGNSTANKVLLDGIPADEIGGTVDFGTLPATGIDQLEVLRGPNSVLYGADAMAGVVSLTTRRGTTPLPELSYSFDAGNFNSLHHDGSLGGAYHRLDYFGEFSRFDTGNSVANNTFHNATSAANIGFALNSSTELRITARHTVDAIGLPNAIDFYGIADDSFQKDQNTFLGITLQNQTTSHWHNLLRYGASRVFRQIDNPSPTGAPFDPFGFGPNYLGENITIHGANGFSTTGQAILDFGGVYPVLSRQGTSRDFGYLQSDYSFNSHLTALFGFRAENERGYTFSVTKNRMNYSYIGQVHGSLGSRFYATLGGSVEDNALFGVAATPRVSLAYYLFRPQSSGPWNGTKLKFNYAQGIKEPRIIDEIPSLFDLLSQLPNGAQLISQFHISPVGAERSRSFDVGVEQLFWNGRGRLAETFFHNRFTDQLEFVDPAALPQLGVPASLLPFFVANRGASINSAATRAMGAETELEFNFGHGFSATANYTYLDAVVLRSFTSDNLLPSMNPNIPNVLIGAFSPLKGSRPFRRAPHTGTFYLSYSRPRLTLSLGGYLVSRRDDSTFLSDPFFGPTMLLPNRNLAPAYQKIDFGGSYRLDRHLAFYASLENLASERYDAAFGFPAPPFTFRAGLKITLGGESWNFK